MNPELLRQYLVYYQDLGFRHVYRRNQDRGAGPLARLPRPPRLSVCGPNS